VNVYRAVWWAAGAGLLATGLGVSWRLPAPVLLVLFAGSGSLCAVLIFFLVLRYGSHTAAGRTRIVASSAVVAGTAAVSTAGLADTLGAGVLAVALFFSLSSPAAVRAVHGWLRSVRCLSAPRLEALTRAFYYAEFASALAHVPAYVNVPMPPTDPQALTDEQLSRSWQTSAWAMRRRISTAQKVALVEERHIYLEEFERRNPSGFAAWLTSGSGAADELMPYLRNGGPEHATINWDELTGGRD
jgi:hypothetical protein